MKLVEILARDWPEWPIGTLAVRQTAGGNITDNSEIIFRLVQGHAEDQETAVVTRAQWEAERARIAELARGQDSLMAVEEAEAHHAEAQKQYEQELWDKAAISAIGGIVASRGFHEYPTYQGVPENAAIFGAQCADAFMAERAKRLKSSS